MKNKFFIVLIFLTVFTTLCAEAVTIDMVPFIKQREKSLESQRSKYELERQRVKKIIELEKKNIVNGKVNSNEVTVCDCDDLKDPYNYPTNFLYDVEKRKTYRINPYCKCKESTGVVSEGEDSEEGYQWDIRY